MSPTAPRSWAFAPWQGAGRWLLGAGLVALLAGLPAPIVAAEPAAAEASGVLRLGPRVARIEARKRDRFERIIDGYSAEGTSVIAWTSAGRIEKIEVEALGEHGRLLLDSYWQGGALIAARERRIDYGKAVTALPPDAPTPMRVASDESVEFSAADRVSRWLLDGKPQTLQGRAASIRGRKLAASAQSFRRLMTAPAPRPATDCDWRCAGHWTDDGGCRRFICR